MSWLKCSIDSHLPVHCWLKYEHLSGWLEIETQTVGVPQAGLLWIEIWPSSLLVGDWNTDSRWPTCQSIMDWNMNIQPVGWRLKHRQWESHRLVHYGLKYDHLAGWLEIETQTVGVPLAGSLWIEIITSGRLVRDWNIDIGIPTGRSFMNWNAIIWPVGWRWKYRQWHSHQPTLHGPKYEHLAGWLGMKTKTLEFPPAGPLWIEILNLRPVG